MGPLATKKSDIILTGPRVPICGHVIRFTALL